MNARRNVPGLNRRGFLAASAAGLGAAGLAASGAAVASASSGSRSQAAAGLTEAVLAAFRSHRLVGLAEEHQLQEHHDMLQTLLADPRLPGVVNDIVVEFGNALYQDTIDAFVLNGQPVADAGLRPVWRNTTQSRCRPGTPLCMSSSSAGSGRSTGRCPPASGSACCSATRRSTGPRSQAAVRSLSLSGTLALSLWLNASGEPAEVAARAGNSTRVLHDVYLHCVSGHNDFVSQRIEDALDTAARAAPIGHDARQGAVIRTACFAQILSAICP